MSEHLQLLIGLAEHLFNNAKAEQSDLNTMLPGWFIGALSAEANYENRFALSNEQVKAYGWILDNITDIQLTNPQPFYRAQIGVLTSMSGYARAGIESISSREVQTAELSQSARKPLTVGRMKPAAQYVGSGRANAHGICVLYCASDINTAILECRAPVGSAVTVANFKSTKPDLRIADLLVKKTPTWTNEQEFKMALINALAIHFCRRVVGDSARYEYTLSQHIAEYLKSRGYDGIAFTSSQSTGQNYAFFDPNIFNLECSQMFEVTQLSISKQILPETQNVGMDRDN